MGRQSKRNPDESRRAQERGGDPVTIVLNKLRYGELREDFFRAAFEMEHPVAVQVAERLGITMLTNGDNNFRNVYGPLEWLRLYIRGNARDEKFRSVIALGYEAIKPAIEVFIERESEHSARIQTLHDFVYLVERWLSGHKLDTVRFATVAVTLNGIATDIANRDRDDSRTFSWAADSIWTLAFALMDTHEIRDAVPARICNAVHSARLACLGKTINGDDIDDYVRNVFGNHFLGLTDWKKQYNFQPKKKKNPPSDDASDLTAERILEAIISFGFEPVPGKSGHWVEPYSGRMVRHRNFLRWAREAGSVAGFKKRINDEIGRFLK